MHRWHPAHPGIPNHTWYVNWILGACWEPHAHLPETKDSGHAFCWSKGGGRAGRAPSRGRWRISRKYSRAENVAPLVRNHWFWASFRRFQGGGGVRMVGSWSGLHLIFSDFLWYSLISFDFPLCLLIFLWFCMIFHWFWLIFIDIDWIWQHDVSLTLKWN